MDIETEALNTEKDITAKECKEDGRTHQKSVKRRYGKQPIQQWK